MLALSIKKLTQYCLLSLKVNSDAAVSQMEMTGQTRFRY